MRQAIALITCLLLVAGAASIGSLFMPGFWYDALAKPAFNPPKLAFPIAFFRRDALAGWLMVPYIAWVAFATVLNVTLWRLNGPG